MFDLASCNSCVYQLLTTCTGETTIDEHIVQGGIWITQGSIVVMRQKDGKVARLTRVGRGGKYGPPGDVQQVCSGAAGSLGCSVSCCTMLLSAPPNPAHLVPWLLAAAW